MRRKKLIAITGHLIIRIFSQAGRRNEEKSCDDKQYGFHIGVDLFNTPCLFVVISVILPFYKLIAHIAGIVGTGKFEYIASGW